MLEPGQSSIEKLLRIKFESDPRGSRFPLPKPPKSHPKNRPYTKNAFLLTPDIARDWLTYRVIRRGFTDRDLLHDEFRDNRTFRRSYVEDFAKVIGGQTKEVWDPGNPEGMIFTPDGFMSDGQHRSAAVLLAYLMGWIGSSDGIEISVSTNSSWSAFDVMNKGRRRNIRDMLGDDVQFKALATGVARHLLPVLDGTEREEFTIPGRDNEIKDIILGWPYFRGSWLGAIMQTKKSRIPQPPLGAAVMGALAAGASESDVQDFLNGLRNDYRDGYPMIGGTGEDPRRLLKLAFPAHEGARKYSLADQRVNAGMIRRAMETWLHRFDDKPIKLQALARTPAHRPIPKVWEADKVRAFHAQYVS